MATPATTGPRSRAIQAKYVVLLVFVAMMVIVWITRDRLLLQPDSFLRQRYSPIAPLMFLHGVPGVIALFLGIFQFSNRLRARFLQVHRVMGRVYVGCVAIAAPVAVIVSIKLPVPTLAAASTIQALGWILTTGTALYCVRTGRISQHREWMMRSYPFAAVFVFVRAITVIPVVARAGAMGLVGTVWASIAVACFLPSFMIAWQHLAASKRPAKVRAA
ncbi:MAG TPA: DUF2306 domain-containing protein [Candidatus Acidoferrales bacterium]|jgi:uncharacterized membrane protein|nr:DUF2306 domain-containing protein [Candidatus Acidoferrales bacterium]